MLFLNLLFWSDGDLMELMEQSREFSRDCGILGVLWWVPTTENGWDSGQKSDLYGGSRRSRGPKVTVFPGQTARSKKEGVYPPPENAKTPGKTHFTMVLTP